MGGLAIKMYLNPGKYHLLLTLDSCLSVEHQCRCGGVYIITLTNKYIFLE